jgi:signal transduction histidine kinase
MHLQETTAALSQARTESDVAEVVLEQGLSVIEGVRGALARVNGKNFQIIRATGYPPHLEARVMALSLDDPTPLTLAVKTGEPVWLQSADEIRDRFPWVYERFGAISSEQTHVAIPLRHRDEMVGALSVSFADATAVGTTDKAFMLLLAQAAADALVRARSFDAEQIARREAETLAQARADVLGIVAHDLRNPLNVITAVGSSLFELDQLPPEERRMVGIMRRCARQMNRLIGDLLDATRLQAGRLTLELTEVDAREVVREADESLQQLAAEHRIELRSEAPKQKCVCRADEQRLLQAIENLVGTALKFTPAGGHVTTAARLSGMEVVFSVSDDGPGIPPESQARLFDSFWQARNGDRRGVGLGLAITKGIVEAHGGRIWVESTVGVGSTFIFALPAKVDAAA